MAAQPAASLMRPLAMPMVRPVARQQLRTATGALLAVAWLSSCAPVLALFERRGPEPATDAAPAPPLGDLALLPVPRTLANRTPEAPLVVAGALAAARTAAGEMQADFTVESFDVPANPRNDAFEEAWTRLERAVVVGDVAAAPSPEPNPVSVERQLLAMNERNIPPGQLHLQVINTRESYQVQLYDDQGRMRTRAIVELAIALRDARSGRVRTIHPRTLAMLYMIGQYYDAPIQVVSGYRVRGENASGGSRHGSGEAVDIRVDGVGPRELSRHVDSTFADVGVGYYPTSAFVHVDNRTRSYYWIDRSGPGQRSRVRTRDAWRPADPDSDVTLRSVHISDQELYQLPPAWREYGY